MQQDVTAYLRSRFQDELSEKFGHVDASCKDLARLRITTYDPDCVANEKATTWQGATEWGKPKTRRELIADKCERAFERSKLNELATLFGGLRDGKAGDAQVGAALTCLALASRGNVYGRVYSETFYPLRSQNVVVGKAGAGKTTMVMSIMDVAKKLEVKLIKPASDASLSHYVANAGATYHDADKTWTPKETPNSLFEIVDEAGISRGVDKRRDYAAKMGAIRRELFGDKIIISSALTREAPDFPVPTRYTSLMLATTKSWADAMTADDAQAGDARRILEFWLPSSCDEAKSDEEAMRMIMQSGRKEANIDAIWEILEPVANRCVFTKLLPLRCSLDEATEIFCLLEKYKHVLGDIDERVAFGSTVFAVLAAHNALLRGSDYIEAEDLQVGAAIACGVLENRIKIRNLGAAPIETEEMKVIREIRQFLEGRSVRLDVLSRRYQSAQRLEDGSVIRLAITQNSVLTIVLGMIQPILLVSLVAVILALVLASRVSKAVVRPLNELNLDEPLNNESFDELSPLLRRIDSQQRQLKGQALELKQKQDEFLAVTSNMSEGLVLLNAGGMILSINNAALNILGADKSCVGEDILTVNRSLEMQQLLEQAKNGSRSETKLCLSGREYQLDASPIISKGNTGGVALLLFDITEQENAEQLRREFTANVSHELKTPLHSISGCAELMKNGLVKPEDTARFAGQIYSEAQRLIHLVEDIIHLSRLDEGAEDMQRERIDLYALSGSVMDSLGNEAKENNVSLELCGAQAFVWGVRQLVSGMVYNLCDNAIKYNRENGSVKLTVSSEGEYAALKVSDTGIGIPPEHQSRVFERFYRVDKSHSKKVGGTGLGLSIVKHSAMVHNAKIDLQSTPGKGTSITVRFPKA